MAKIGLNYGENYKLLTRLIVSLQTGWMYQQFLEN